MTSLIARNVEQALMSVRTFNREFPIKCTNIIVPTLKDLRAKEIQKLLTGLPPLEIGRKYLASAKDILERMGDRDISMEEIVEMSKFPVTSNPILLIQERKKDMIARAQAELSKEMKEYFLLLENLNKKALGTASESLIFQEQHRMLPRYLRRNVMFGYPLIGGVSS